MRVKYDKSSDSAYVYLKNVISPGESKHTYKCDPLEVNGAMIVIDFDEKFVFLGIEVMDASKHLPQELIDQEDKQE